MSWARRAAHRRNARLRAAFPLLDLSGDLPIVTAEQLLAAEARRRASMAACNARQLRAGRRFRQLVARRISAAEIQVLDQRRSICPPTAEYDADFWRGEALKIWRHGA